MFRPLTAGVSGGAKKRREYALYGTYARAIIWIYGNAYFGRFRLFSSHVVTIINIITNNRDINK